MSKYHLYSLRQLFEAVRNGRGDVALRACTEIERRLAMPFDVDAYMAKRAKIQRDQEREDWGATCPHCGADVLSSLKKSAYEWGGYGPPSTATFECPDCEKELVFDLEWSTELWRASLLTEDADPPELGEK